MADGTEIGIADAGSAINTVTANGNRSLTGAGLAGDAYAINRAPVRNKSSTTEVQSLAGRDNRLTHTGLKSGGTTARPPEEPTVSVLRDGGPGKPDIPIEDDWRIRLSLATDSNIFYKGENPGLMAPLKETNGVVFPYTPKIVVTHLANYSPVALTHSNYHQQFFSDSQVSDIVISGDFTVQNIDEGKYLLAVIYFFRAATKMFFGNGENVGNPPPVVFLNGYGDQYFPNVPCVITNVSHDMPDDVDYISVPTTNGTSARYLPETKFVRNNSTGQEQAVGSINQTAVRKPIVNNTRVPAVSRLSLTVRPIYSRENLANNFNLTEFAAGRLLGKDGNGGFL